MHTPVIKRRIDHRKLAFALAVLVTVLAVWLRYSLRWHVTNDYLCCHQVWYEYIKLDGSYAFINSFSNLAMPILYAWYLVGLILPDLPTLLAVKIPAVICDFILAYFFFKIVSEGIKNPYLRLLAYATPLFTPTVFLNSAWWGQFDSCYVAPVVAGIYYLLKRKEWLAFLFFGLGFSVKFQMVFILPFLLILLMRKKVNGYNFLLMPIIYFVSIVPAWIRGRSLVSLLLIYTNQASQYQRLNMNAPTLYSWISDDHFKVAYPLGILLAGLICLVFIYIGWKKGHADSEVTGDWLLLAMLSSLILPVFLPMMQGRYYYLAEIFALLVVFYKPRLIVYPIVLQILALYTYTRYFFGHDPNGIGLKIGSIIMLILFLSGAWVCFVKGKKDPNVMSAST